MSLRVRATAVIFVLAVTTVFAQDNAPASAPARGPCEVVDGLAPCGRLRLPAIDFSRLRLATPANPGCC